jgi:hypothetical protein
MKSSRNRSHVVGTASDPRDMTEIRVVELFTTLRGRQTPRAYFFVSETLYTKSNFTPGPYPGGASWDFGPQHQRVFGTFVIFFDEATKDEYLPDVQVDECPSKKHFYLPKSSRGSDM